MRVVSLNLRAYPNHARITELAELIAAQEPDIALLQECRPHWVEVVCERAGLSGAHSHEIEPRLPFPPDGCGIAVRSPLQIDATRRVAPEAFEPEVINAVVADAPLANPEALPPRLAARYSARTLLAEIRADGMRFSAGSFHATPGTGRVGGRRVREWKPLFHGGVAVELAKLELPFVFAVDANEPLAETAGSVAFHWEEGRSGAKKLAALLGLRADERVHRARDLLREALSEGRLGAEAADHLALTYTTRGGAGRRFDSIWATREFELGELTTHYEDALKAGGDHALLLAELDLA